MSAGAYTEDQLVEQPAIGLFAELGWQTVLAMTLAGAKREVCGLMKDGVKVQVPDRERGGLKDERVHEGTVREKDGSAIRAPVRGVSGR